MNGLFAPVPLRLWEVRKAALAIEDAEQIRNWWPLDWPMWITLAGICGHWN